MDRRKYLFRRSVYLHGHVYTMLPTLCTCLAELATGARKDQRSPLTSGGCYNSWSCSYACMGKRQCRHEHGYHDLGGGSITANTYLHRIPDFVKYMGFTGFLIWALAAYPCTTQSTQAEDQRTPSGFTIFWGWGSIESHTTDGIALSRLRYARMTYTIRCPSIFGRGKSRPTVEYWD
jgi:hypothetical protein